MAEQRKKTTPRAKGPAQTLPPEQQPAPSPLRVQSEAPIVDLGKDTLVFMAREWDRKRVNSALGELMSRESSLEAVLLEVAKSADKAVERSLRDNQERLTAESRREAQYREQLRAGKGGNRVRASKGAYLLGGQVLHPETGEPVAGLLVEAVDRDERKQDLLGSAITDEQGRFSIKFPAKDFKESGEREPELVLLVGTDRKSRLHVTTEPLTAKPGERQDVVVTLPPGLASRVDAFSAARERLQPARLRRAGETAVRLQLESEVVKAAGESLQQLLQAGITALEVRARPGGKASEKA